MSKIPTPSLDHLVLFLPADPTTNLPQIPPFIAENFTLAPGGTHADGLTSNTLIPLPDATYIELITFLPTAPPHLLPTHWWSSPSPHAHPSGWTDWCLTNALPPTTNHATYLPTTHAPPLPGSRTPPNNAPPIKWAVTFPQGPHGGQAVRGKIPFFCHDVTERAWRVPMGEDATRHPCGARGVREVSVVVGDEAAVEEVRGVYRKVFGQEGVEEAEGVVVFEAERVEQVEGLEGGARILLRVPRNAAEKEKVAGRGFWFGDVVLSARAREGKAAGMRERLDGGEDDVRGLWVEYV